MLPVKRKWVEIGFRHLVFWAFSQERQNGAALVSGMGIKEKSRVNYGCIGMGISLRVALRIKGLLTTINSKTIILTAVISSGIPTYHDNPSALYQTPSPAPSSAVPSSSA